MNICIFVVTFLLFWCIIVCGGCNNFYKGVFLMVKEKSKLRIFTDKLFGGLNMSWPAVIIFAVASAVVTSVFLIVPIFSNTSFYEMGVSFEAWFLFAIIIMTNCEKPLESALKTFVFFLISQPLIYLFQVPFSYMGFGLFMYYKYWFNWTLLTFPMALAGWFLKKRNWISLFIILPVIAFMALMGTSYLHTAIISFPSHILAALFCYGQIILYLYAFFKEIMQWAAGLGVAVIMIVLTFVFMSNTEMSVGMPLPDEPKLSHNAVAVFDDDSFGTIEFVDYEDAYINIHIKKLEPTVITVTDGDRQYKYDVKVITENGTQHIDLVPKK